MSEFTYGLKVVDGQCNAKCVKVCREHTNLSMSEIRRRVEAGEYLITLDAIEDGVERKLNKFKKALAQVGVTAEVFENDEPISEEFMNNWAQTKRETAKFVAWESAAELGEDMPEDWEDFEYEYEDEEDF